MGRSNRDWMLISGSLTAFIALVFVYYFVPLKSTAATAPLLFIVAAISLLPMFLWLFGQPVDLFEIIVPVAAGYFI